MRHNAIFREAVTLKIQDGGGRHLKKITKIAMSLQRFDRSLLNFYDDAKQVSPPLRTFKNLNFKNPRWRTATILKTVNSTYFCNLLTDFYEMWHNDAYWFLAPDVKFKFVIFDNLLRRTAAILRIEKLLKYTL